MAIHLLRTIKNNHNIESLVGEHLIPCCGHHIDHVENESEVHIQGCFTGINFWVHHTNKKVKLTTESQNEIVILQSEYEDEIKNFVDKVEKFYIESKLKIMPSDDYDKIGYEKMWLEWKKRRTELKQH